MFLLTACIYSQALCLNRVPSVSFPKPSDGPFLLPNFFLRFLPCSQFFPRQPFPLNPLSLYMVGLAPHQIIDMLTAKAAQNTQKLRDPGSWYVLKNTLIAPERSKEITKSSLGRKRHSLKIWIERPPRSRLSPQE